MIARLIGTVLGVGYLRPAPGTWGSLVALPWGWLLHEVGGFSLLIAGIVVAFFAGWWATTRMTSGADDHDPSEIVMDEVVGQWIAILPMSIAATFFELNILALWPGWIAAFVLFRFFDIWKPLFIGWIDRRGTPLSVMLDDVFAGVVAALGVMLLAGFAHAL